MKTFFRNISVLWSQTLLANLNIHFALKTFFHKKQKLFFIVKLYVLSNILLQNLSGVLKNKLQKLQNWNIHYIFKQRKFDQISPYFKKLNTLNMEKRQLLYSLTQMLKKKYWTWIFRPTWKINSVKRFAPIQYSQKNLFLKISYCSNQSKFVKKCATRKV